MAAYHTRGLGRGTRPEPIRTPSTGTTLDADGPARPHPGHGPPVTLPSLAGSSRNGAAPVDTIVVGSGFGGAIAAAVLTAAGHRVLMLERGDWVARGPHNRDWAVPWKDLEAYCNAAPYHVAGSECPRRLGAFHCVGGPSVFYGGVAMRLREADFHGDPHISGDVRWPIDYDELEPHYAEIERMLGVTGESVNPDPTEPSRRQPLPQTPIELSPTSRALHNAALSMGYRPFRLPLALHVAGDSDRSHCTRCGTCDGFACAIGAKNDLATVVVPDLIERGMRLRTNTIVTGLDRDGRRIGAVHAVDRRTGERLRFTAERVVLAAGALGTPHLLLSSGLEAGNPAGDAVGRYLMRHCNGIVGGAAPGSIGHPEDFRKQLGVHDLYFGDPGSDAPSGKLGAIQQLRATRIALSMLPLPASLKRALDPFLGRSAAFIVLAEDQPRPENRVTIDATRRDAYGRPIAHVHHQHTPRDRAARGWLAKRAAEILRAAGCAFTVRQPVRTFSHALGSVRMGEDPARFPVAPDGRFRGVDNLWITDGSVFPTSGAVNPSLTIAANARRIAAGIAAERAPTATKGAHRVRVPRVDRAVPLETPDA